MFGSKPNVLICGNDGVGKSSLALDLLVSKGYIIHPLAYCLRMDLANESSWTLQELWQKPTPSLVRRALIDFGEAKKEEHGELHWCERWQAYSKSLRTKGPLVVDDCRYPYEVDYIRKTEGDWLVLFLKDTPILKEGYYYSELHKTEALCQHVLNVKKNGSFLLTKSEVRQRVYNLLGVNSKLWKALWN